MGVFSERSFAANTRYRVVEQGGIWVLEAETRASASALYREMDIDLLATPYLNWSWRVDNVYPIAHQQKKPGDDYPARVYVVVKYGFFPWQTRALNYVWSNYRETALFWPNPFSAQAMMIPLQVGDEGLGLWQDERVNIVEDYFRIFHEHIDRAHGVAIMSDSDNAGGEAIAFYGDIYFSD